MKPNEALNLLPITRKYSVCICN